MHAFSNAHDMIVSNNNFVDNSHTTTVTLDGGPSGIQTLLNSSIPDASHDSFARDPPPQCLPGTRVQHIEDITHWALDLTNDTSLPILWMKGPAGVGKSALAQTCTEKIGDKLGAAFFFSRDVRDDPKRFFTTIAYQLSTKFQAYSEILDAKIRRDVTLVAKSMPRQFQELIAQPFQELERRGAKPARMAIFVDGLDECMGEAAQSEIIEIVATSARRRTTPFCWAFFSRAEPHIEATFSRDDIAVLCRRSTLPISREIDGEIELYLREGFRHILQHRNLRLLASWPSDRDLQRLINASAGLFIYAAAVLRFIGQSGSRGPEDQLRAVLAVISDPWGRPSAGTALSPFAELDRFYMLIMKCIPSTILTSIQRILLATTLVKGSGAGWCVQLLSNVIGLSELDFMTACNKLHAVLRIHDRRPESAVTSSTDHTQPFNPVLGSYTGMKLRCTGLEGYISFYHKSFNDFLSDPSRSNDFCIKTPTLANQMFWQCLDIHNAYIRTYNFKSKPLTLAPGIPSSASSLTWPHETEYVNSFLKLRVYGKAIRAMFELYRLFPLDHQLLEELVDLDYAKMLRLDLDPGEMRPGRWGTAVFFPSATPRVAQEVLDKVPKHLRNRILRPHTSGIISRCLLFLQRNSRKHQSHQYTIGHGTKKVLICRNEEGNVYFVANRW